MSGPRTLTAGIRKLHERALAANRNRRARKRKSEGYVGAGPVDIPSDLVQVMIDMGDLDAGRVKWDEAEPPQVDREFMTEAMHGFLERLSATAPDLPRYLSEGDGERLITSIAFCQEIGLSPSAPGQRFGTVMAAIESAGYEVVIRKKKWPE